MSLLSALVESAVGRVATIGADSRDSDEQRQRKALLVLLALMILPVSLLWGSLYLALGSQVGFVPFLYLATSAASIAIFAWTRQVELLLRVQLLDILLAPTLSQIPIGGFLSSGGVGLWGILAPLGALVFGGVRSGTRWFVAFVVVFLASGIAGEFFPSASILPAWFNSTMLALNIVVAGTIVFALLALFARQRQEALAALRTEQDKADTLLLNILPRSIAEKLKSDTATIADQFDAASILFADVVDFTPLSEHLPPAEVVRILDHLFTHFDVLAERHDLEKIKTIGDCYMVAGGLPEPRADHAAAMVEMGLAMLGIVAELAVRTGESLDVRVGIHSGPVVAGVIGKRKFIYDL